MRSRLAVTATTAVLATVTLVLGSGGTAHAADRPDNHPDRVTVAYCHETGGSVWPIGLAGSVCIWFGPNGFVDAESAQITG
ncbi:hypothetical protein LDL48_24770 [Wangella sp. NEAU-J3]|nr:hypothetical protein [Jidongwangia harbinensis]